MPIRVLFFGATADEAGVRSQEFALPEDTRAGNLVERVVTDHPSLRRHRLLFSVNEEYVPDDTTLKDGDEVAIFTAVSGG